MRKLKSQQFKTISEFCNDIAKGLMLGVFLGQITLATSMGAVKILASLFYFLMSLIMFYLAVYFSKEIKS